jgi:SAM-dependent methyltransferase
LKARAAFVNRIDQCPVCDSPSRHGWPALVAPFIADFVLQSPVERCHLRECETCGLRFFAERFTGPELARLYTDYRGAAYYRTRHRHEPWYSERFNVDIGHNPQRGAARRAGLTAFLHDSGAPGPFESILDYGGDAGQLIPQEMTGQSYVYDISGVPPVSGVARIAKEEDLQSGGYGLVLLSHVLEHVPDPLDLLRALRRLAREDGGLVYVEVPLERPWMGFLGRGAATIAWLDSLRRSALLLRLFDFYSSAFRIKAGFLPPLGFSKLHEHVNFFSAKSLRLAVERSGFTVLNLAPVSTSGKGQPNDSLACLARTERLR